MTVFVVESLSYDGLFECLTIFVGHFPFFLFLGHLFGDVCEGAEDVDRHVFLQTVFGYALIMHVTPLAEAFDAAHVPSEYALVANSLASVEALDELAVDVAVFWVYEVEAFQIAHASFGEQIAVEIVGVLCSDI